METYLDIGEIVAGRVYANTLGSDPAKRVPAPGKLEPLAPGPATLPMRARLIHVE
jgi:hypothetical protein